MKKFLVLCLLLCALFGCKPANNPNSARATARSAVLTMTVAVKVAAGVCINVIEIHEEQGDEEGAQLFGNKCKAILLPVMVTLKAAASAVDSWNDDATAGEKVACAAKNFVPAVPAWARLVDKEGGIISVAVTDAMIVAQPFLDMVTPNCKVATP